MQINPVMRSPLLFFHVACCPSVVEILVIGQSTAFNRDTVVAAAVYQPLPESGYYGGVNRRGQV